MLSDNGAEKVIYGRLLPLVNSSVREGEEVAPFCWDAEFGEKEKTQPSSHAESSPLYQQVEMKSLAWQVSPSNWEA